MRGDGRGFDAEERDDVSKERLDKLIIEDARGLRGGGVRVVVGSG